MKKLILLIILALSAQFTQAGTSACLGDMNTNGYVGDTQDVDKLLDDWNATYYKGVPVNPATDFTEDGVYTIDDYMYLHDNEGSCPLVIVPDASKTTPILSGSYTGGSVTAQFSITWTDSTSASQYTVQESFYPDFREVAYERTTSGKSYPFYKIGKNRSWYYRVKKSNADAWSNVVTVSVTSWTVPEPTPKPVVYYWYWIKLEHKITTVGSYYPKVGTELTLSWRGSSNLVNSAAKYVVEMSAYSDFRTVIWRSNVSGPTAKFGWLAHGYMYFRIRNSTNYVWSYPVRAWVYRAY